MCIILAENMSHINFFEGYPEIESPSVVDSSTFDWISTRLLLTLETAVNTPLTPMSKESLNTKAAIMKPL